MSVVGNFVLGQTYVHDKSKRFKRSTYGSDPMVENIVGSDVGDDRGIDRQRVRRDFDPNCFDFYFEKTGKEDLQSPEKPILPCPSKRSSNGSVSDNTFLDG